MKADAERPRFDLPVLRRKLTIDKRATAQLRQECAILERALAAPGLTAEDATAIAQRAEEIIGWGHRMHIKALADMGDLLLRARPVRRCDRGRARGGSGRREATRRSATRELDV
jgi:hypothetical protein